MRKYEPIWLALKKDKNHTVSLAAPMDLHARIIQAVRKEKSNDYAWKYEQLETNTRYKLVETMKGELITFTLEVDTRFYIKGISL